MEFIPESESKIRKHSDFKNVYSHLKFQAIEKRKALIKDAGGFDKFMEQKTEATGHRKMAFLDLMLQMVEKGDLDRAGLQEEVDTFVFEVSNFNEMAF